MLNILHNQSGDVTTLFRSVCAHQKLNTYHRTADGIRSGGERNLIGRRTESNRTADGIQSDGGRNLIGRRTEHDDKTLQSGLKK